MRCGLDFGGTNLKSGLFEEDGRVIQFGEIPLQDLRAGGDLLDAMIAEVRRRVAGRRLSAGGLAVKGMVDTAAGTVADDIGAGSLLVGQKVRDRFAAALEIPFAMDNDARSYAWGEWRFGAGRGSRVMACLTLGTGLGSSLVAHGVPYEGSDPLGGLLGGHISIDRNGPECPCGHRGCLELYCSATAMRRRVIEEHPAIGGMEGDPLARFFALAGEGAARVQPLFREFIGNLALGVVNVIHAYGPDTVVLGGGVMKSAAVILPPLEVEVHRMAWTFPRASVRIRAANLGSAAAAVGAAFHPQLSAASSEIHFRT